METIIDFAYIGNVPITSENAQELFMVADRFIVEGIKKACSDFMEQMLEPQNCLGIWQFTDMYYHPKLRDKAFLFVLNHFEEVADTEEFLALSAEELVQVIKRDELRVTQESKVYEAALRWVTHDTEERRKHLPRLLSNVRLALTGQHYFSHNVAENELVMANEECNPIISNATRVLIEIRTRSRRRSFSMVGNRFTRPRLPSAILFAVGGWSGGSPTNVIEAYDKCANSWITVNDTEPEPRAYHGTVHLDGFIYCIGGYDTVVTFCTMSRFDVLTHRWQEVAPMHWRRCYVSVTVMDGYIYAIGGCDGRHRLESAERYLPSTNQWTVIAPMNEKRSDSSCANFCGKVYICGGFSGIRCLSTAECYNPEADQWTMIAEMSSRRSGIGVIAFADHIFAVGGFDGVNRLNSVEAYNPNSDTWHDVASMHTTRSNFGIGLIDDCLFVVGGYNGVTPANCMESYNVETNMWTRLHAMVVRRSALSCCVVSGSPNLAEYAAPRPQLLEEDDLD